MSSETVRVRFAPSPTGLLHVGNARTALFNWLFARQRGGTFILRIEDTDVERSEERHEAQIYEDLRWLGLEWNEGPVYRVGDGEGSWGGGPYAPYRQSERMQIYQDFAARLLREGKAYLCFCTPEDLERERREAIAEHRTQRYSGRCRRIDPAEAERRRDAGELAAVRLHIPDRPIRFHDIVHGEVEFSGEVVGDPIVVRSSPGLDAAGRPLPGIPVYNFVVVVDDALMEITHVIRGDDHLSNTPRQVALYEALGFEPPAFAHLSTILGADRERLSKRHGAVSIAHFREMGVLPEALVNYLALLGWAPAGGTREIFALDELVREFSLERVTPSPAVFDFDKLHWLNRHHLHAVRSERLNALALPYFTRAGLLDEHATPEAVAWFDRVIELLAPSVDRLDQLPARAALLFGYDAARARADEANREVLATPHASAVLDAFARRVRAEAAPLAAERFKALVAEVKAETGAKGRDLFHPIRVMLTGSASGPEFDKLVPLIEEGSALPLPRHVPSVRERVEAFEAAASEAA